MANVAYFERALAQPNTLQPDRLAQSGRKPPFKPVSDKLELGDASHAIEVHRITGGPHSDSFLMVYLPKERLLIEADAFTPAAAGTPPPAVPNPNHLNLKVERIVPLHGRVVPVSELYTAAGMTAR